MLKGERINLTEGRSALHTALRRPVSEPLIVDGADVMVEISKVRAQMRAFSDAVRGGEWVGRNGKTITDVVNIGIGGSDLGPAMVCEALTPFARADLRVHFVSNLDAAHFERATSGIDADRTLFIIASKTFTTLETMTNARTARRWFLERGGKQTDIARHFVALSTNEKAVRAFGIDPGNMFRFWDWVGGRYSLWSAIGLPVAIAVGMDRFEELLSGANCMDRHFAEAPLEYNMPVIMALLGVWYRNFFGFDSHAVVPYDQNLSRFPSFLQQLDMESNGKRVYRSGRQIESHATGPIVWGEPGCNSQHSFFQWLHQGTGTAPVDFLLAARSHYPVGEHHRLLAASCLAQSRALMIGRTAEETRQSLDGSGVDPETIEQRLPHSVFPGNRPSNTLLYPRLDPFILGMLIALYEHKVFVQGAIWDVNSFDQFGVELGKQLTAPIAALLETDDSPDDYDSSTAGLIDFLRNGRK
jgi:glucose-6-phosphate isomerase